MLQQAFEDAPFFGLSLSARHVSVQDVCVVCQIAELGRPMDMALEAAALVILTTLSSTHGFDEVSIPSKAILAACAGTRWLHTHWELRAVRMLGPRMLPILYAMYDTLHFCFGWILGTTRCKMQCVHRTLHPQMPTTWCLRSATCAPSLALWA